MHIAFKYDYLLIICIYSIGDMAENLMYINRKYDFIYMLGYLLFCEKNLHFPNGIFFERIILVDMKF